MFYYSESHFPTTESGDELCLWVCFRFSNYLFYANSGTTVKN